MAKFLYPLSLVNVITSALVMLLFGKNIAPNTENKILPSFLISNVYKVEQITGAGSLNATAANCTTQPISSG